MFRSHPLLARFFLFIGLPLLLLACAAMLYVRASRIETSGTVLVDGARAAVSIRRDAHGVVHIKAASDRDAYFAMGYAHAQDRLWQMETARRLAQGRLSEVFGREAIKQDVWFRTLGLSDAAALAWPKLSGEAQDSLTAYADGVNAWRDQGGTLPPEFHLLGVAPERWRPVDSLMLIKVFALNLAGNLNQEIEHYVARQTLSPPQMAALFGAAHDAGPVTIPPGAASVQLAQTLTGLRHLQSEIEVNAHVGGRFVGSNAWAIAGRLTADGAPILANDPHMSLQMPSLWYAVRLDGDKVHASGMSLIGLPIIVFGKNEHIAWGGTSMMADVQDIYFEQPNSLDPTTYLSGHDWKKFRVRNELIHVKAAFPTWLHKDLDPVKLQVRESERGPIVSDVIDALDQPLALRWTALDADDTTYESFFRLNYATDWNSFRDALRFHVAPALNMLYIDDAGNIGYLGAGRIPVRAKGRGALPSPGWTGEFRWEGYIPADEMPHSFNPPAGYIVSANNRIAGPQYRHFISDDWAPPARAQRIEQMLGDAARKGHPISTEYVQQMQRDQVNLEARQLLPLLSAVVPASARQQRAVKYLAAWDGSMSRDSQAASIYMAWMYHLREKLFANPLRQHWNLDKQAPYMDAIVHATSAELVGQALAGKGYDWCDRPAHGGSCDALMRESLDLALDELVKLKGGNMEQWRWGDLHTIHFKHTPFSDVKLLDVVFERSLANGGSPATVNTADARLQGAAGYVQHFGPAFRQIMQMAPGRHLYMNSTGQSGIPWSAHYDDMIDPYGAGQYVNFLPTESAKLGPALLLSPRHRGQR